MISIFSQSLTTDADNYNGLTIVQRLTVASLSLPASRKIVNVRVNFAAGSTENLAITNAYIGHAADAGDAYDFAATPVQLKFSGNAGVTITANTTTWSDPASFRYNKTSALLIAFYLGGGTGADMIRYKAAVANVADYYKSANDAATVDKTGYTLEDQVLSVVSAVQVRVFPTQAVLNWI